MKKKVRRFEDLIAWQKAMDLAMRVYEISDQPLLSRDFPLLNQMHGAAISVPSNIAEGFERGSRTEFHRFLTIAKASCAELRTQLILARRIRRLNETDAKDALTLAEDVARTIGKLRIVVAKQKATPLMPHASCPMPATPEEKC
jgi:four helix bundle protein